MSVFWRRFLQVAGTFVAFALMSRLGSLFQVENGVSVFYPATAVDIISCMYFGGWGALGILLGSLVTPWEAKDSLFKLLVSALLNITEGMLPYLVFRFRRELMRDLRDLKSFLAFLIFGTVINSAISALIGNLLLIPHPPGELINGRQFFIWWISDFSAALLLAAPLLAFAGNLFRRMTGDRTVEPPRRLSNVLEVTLVIILLGWMASAGVRTVLQESFEDERSMRARTSLSASQLVTAADRNVVITAESIRSWDKTEPEMMRRRVLLASETNRLLLDDLAKVLVRADAETRQACATFRQASEKWFKSARDSLSDDVRGTRSLRMLMISLNTRLEESDSVVIAALDERRSKVRTVALVMDVLVLMILMMAGASLILTITRPLKQLHLGVAALKSGANFDPRTVESNFVEIRTLADTLSETSVELKAREYDLRLQTARALAASRSKTEFFAKMSHELRTPLNSIVGFSELLLDRADIDEGKRVGFLQNILRSGNHLLKLINDLLDIARMESGRIRLTHEVFDMRQVVASAVASTEALFEKKLQKIELELGDEPLLLRGDPMRVEQMILNLLSNANKFGPENEPIVVIASREGEQARLEVTDRGIGIDRDDQQRIFEEFEQVGSGAHAVAGTGLGLALVRQFVEACHGTVDVKSEPGRGATFYLRIPLDGSDAATEHPVYSA